jgi:hypothetical protein
VGEIVFNATNYNTPYDEPYYGSINCKVYNVPTVAQVSYYSYNKSCNGTNAQKIVVHMTYSCKEGCHQENGQYVYVTRGRGVQHLDGAHWAETVHFALMRNNRAPSLSHATVGMLKEAPSDTREQLCNTISHYLASASYLAEWRTGHLRLLFKGKGDPPDPANYRPINLTEALYRLTEVVIWQ